MRIQNVQQSFRNLRELIVQLVMHSAAEKCERLDQALHMRVLAGIRLEHQPAGDLRVLLPELRRHLADESQLALVVGEQFVSHESAPETMNRRESRYRA